MYILPLSLPRVYLCVSVCRSISGATGEIPQGVGGKRRASRSLSWGLERASSENGISKLCFRLLLARDRTLDPTRLYNASMIVDTLSREGSLS